MQYYESVSIGRVKPRSFFEQAEVMYDCIYPYVLDCFEMNKGKKFLYNKVNDNALVTKIATDYKIIEKFADSASADVRVVILGAIRKARSIIPHHYDSFIFENFIDKERNSRPYSFCLPIDGIGDDGGFPFYYVWNPRNRKRIFVDTDFYPFHKDAKFLEFHRLAFTPSLRNWQVCAYKDIDVDPAPTDPINGVVIGAGSHLPIRMLDLDGDRMLAGGLSEAYKNAFDAYSKELERKSGKPKVDMHGLRIPNLDLDKLHAKVERTARDCVHAVAQSICEKYSHVAILQPVNAMHKRFWKNAHFEIFANEIERIMVQKSTVFLSKLPAFTFLNPTPRCTCGRTDGIIDGGKIFCPIHRDVTLNHPNNVMKSALFEFRQKLGLANCKLNPHESKQE